MKGVLRSVLFLTFLAMAGAASAIEPIPSAPGWSGYVAPGVTVISARTNMVYGISAYNIKIGKKRIDSFADEPESSSQPRWVRRDRRCATIRASRRAAADR